MILGSVGLGHKGTPGSGVGLVTPGGTPQPSASALKLSDNSSFLLLANGGRLLLAQG